MVDNTAAGGAVLDAGYQLTVTLAWKPGLAADFSNLRVFDADGVTRVPFFITPTRVVKEVSATVWLKLPALAKGKRVLYYDGGATHYQSDGYAVFESFDDFREGSVNFARWTTTTTLGGAVNVAPGIRFQRAWSKQLARAQTFAFTPYGLALTNHDLDTGQTGHLYMVNRNTGEDIRSPVDSIGHPWTMFYVPEADYIVVCGDAGTGLQGAAWVHKASDLSYVGRLQVKSTGSASVTYYGANQILVGMANNSYQIYSVNWNKLAITPTENFPQSGTVQIKPQTVQGISYSQRDGRLYILGNTSDNMDSNLWVTDFSTGTQALAGRYRQLPGRFDHADTTAEPEGIAFDENGYLWFGMLSGTTFYLRRAILTYENVPDRNGAQGNPQGRGVVLFAPRVKNAKAIIRSNWSLTGRTRTIFGLYNNASISHGGSGASYPHFGLSSDDRTRLLWFFRSASGDDNNTIRSYRAAPGKMTANTSMTLPNAVVDSSDYIIDWDGVSAKFKQNNTVVGMYADVVPPLADAGSLKLEISADAGSTPQNGSVVIAYYVATAKLVPPGVVEPTLRAD